MGKTRRNKKSFFLGAIVVLLIVFLLSSALLGIKIWEGQQGKYSASEPEISAITYNDTQYVLKDNIEAFLVMGLDKFEESTQIDSYNNNQQADFLMLFVFDKNAQKCSAIHINRDTMAHINVLGVAGQKIDTVTKQIALAHTYGNGKEVSCRNTLDAVSKLLLGTKINHYISLTMDSVPCINDLVGGVEVTVLDDFTGIDNTLIKGETVTLLGEHSLNYVRTRYGLEDSTNSTRMKRQQQYIKALYEKIRQRIEADDEFVIDAAVKMSEYIVSDRSVNQLQELVKRFNEYEFTGIVDIKGESKQGEEFMEFYPDADSLEATVIDLFYKPIN